MFNDTDQNDRYIERELKVIQEDKGHSVIRSEFYKALRELYKRKLSRIDTRPSELMKNAGQNSIDRFYKLTCTTYKERVISKNFQRSRIVMITKKVRENKCEDY